MVTKEMLTQGYSWRTYNGSAVYEYGLAGEKDKWTIVRTSLSAEHKGWRTETIAHGLTDDEAVAYLNLILY
jgi:hypothetical protein